MTELKVGDQVLHRKVKGPIMVVEAVWTYEFPETPPVKAGVSVFWFDDLKTPHRIMFNPDDLETSEEYFKRFREDQKNRRFRP